MEDQQPIVTNQQTGDTATQVPAYQPPSMTPIDKNYNPKEVMPSVGDLNTFDNTKEVTEEGANVLQEAAKAKSLEGDVLPNFHIGPGINLLPTKTEQEIVIEKKTISINMYAAGAIVILLIITIAVYGYNLVTKLTLNSEKRQLAEMEEELKSYSQIIEANNDILARFDLYNDIQLSTFSPKEVLNYWKDLFTGYGNLNSLELANGLDFTVEGDTKSLRDVAFLWHLLTVNEKVSETNLENFSKGDEDARFSFEGKLDDEYFINKQKEKIEEENEESSVQGVNIIMMLD